MQALDAGTWLRAQPFDELQSALTFNRDFTARCHYGLYKEYLQHAGCSAEDIAANTNFSDFVDEIKRFVGNAIWGMSNTQQECEQKMERALTLMLGH